MSTLNEKSTAGLTAGQEIRKPYPFRVHYATRFHAAICGKRGSDYASSAVPTAVNCPKCIAVIKDRAHNAECEAAAMALLNERARQRA